MVGTRICRGRNARGEPCNATVLRGEELCFWHSPEHAQEAAEARRLGGLRRRREGALHGAYDFEGLGSFAELRRLLEIAALDALGLDNSVARVRALTSVVQVGARLLEIGDLEARLAAIEGVLGPRIREERAR